MPAKMKVAQFNGGLFNDNASRDLFRFERQDRGRHWLRLAVGEGGADLGFDLGGLDVAHDDKEDVVGRVFLTIVRVDILAPNLVKDVRVADNCEAVRAACVSRFEKTTGGALARVVLVHVHFAEDDLFFLFQLLGGNAGVLHDVAKDIDGHFPASVRNVDPVDRAIERSIGVHVTTGVLHLLINPSRWTRGGALEKHMFKHVR